MGFTLRRAPRAAAARPGPDPDDRAPPRALAGGWAAAGAGVALVVRGLLLSALVLALAGFQLVLPVDRLATVFVVDLSDSVGNAGREDALAFLRDTLARSPTATSRGSSPSAGRRWSNACRPASTDIDRIASTPVTTADRHRRGAAARRPRCSPTTPRSGSSSSPTATTRPATGRPRRPWPPPAASGSRPAGSASGTSTRCSWSASPRRRRRGSASRSRSSPRSARPSPRRPPSALYADGALVATQPGVQLGRGAHPGDLRRQADRRPASIRFRAVVEAALDTFSQNDRADSNTIVKGEPRTLVLAGRRQGRRRAGGRAREPDARPSTRSSRRPCRPISPASRRTTASSSSTCRGCA